MLSPTPVSTVVAPYWEAAMVAMASAADTQDRPRLWAESACKNWPSLPTGRRPQAEALRTSTSPFAADPIQSSSWVSVTASGTPVPPVLRPITRWVARLAILAKVTDPSVGTRWSDNLASSVFTTSV